MSKSFSSQLGFLGLWGKKVDAMDHFTAEIEKLSDQVSIFFFSRGSLLM